MAINKVVYDGNTLIDLTEDTVTPETLMEGATAHNAAGEQIVGSVVNKAGTLVVEAKFENVNVGATAVSVSHTQEQLAEAHAAGIQIVLDIGLVGNDAIIYTLTRNQWYASGRIEFAGMFMTAIFFAVYENGKLTIQRADYRKVGENIPAKEVAFDDGETFQQKYDRGALKGDTPVKGTDYYTAEDKAEMVNLVLAALPVAEEASF